MPLWVRADCQPWLSLFSCLWQLRTICFVFFASSSFCVANYSCWPANTTPSGKLERHPLMEFKSWASKITKCDPTLYGLLAVPNQAAIALNCLHIQLQGVKSPCVAASGPYLEICTHWDGILQIQGLKSQACQDLPCLLMIWLGASYQQRWPLPFAHHACWSVLAFLTSARHIIYIQRDNKPI